MSASKEFGALFNLDAVRGDSPRLMALKEHDVQTHHAPHSTEAPWLAVPMKAARSVLQGYDLTDDESGSVAGIMAGYCRLLDEAGLTFTGQTEREVQDAALAYCGWCSMNEFEEAVRAAVTRLHGRFTLLAVIEDMRAHSPTPDVDSGIAVGGVGFVVRNWRERNLVRVAEGEGFVGRVYEVTDEWEPT